MIWLSKKIIKHHLVTVDQENKTTIGMLPETIEVTSYDHVQDTTANADWEVQDAKNLARDTMREAGQKADDIIEAAHAEARRVVEEAQAKMNLDKEDIFEKARQDGVSQGYDEGYKDGERAAQQMKDDAKRELDQAVFDRENALQALEPEIINMVIKLVGKLAETSVRINPSVVLNLVKQGLAEASFTEDVTLRVSKDDFDFVVEHKDELMQYVVGGAGLEIVADHSLNAADCLIETPFGVVDSSLNMQLQEIKQDLAQILEGNN